MRKRLSYFCNNWWAGTIFLQSDQEPSFDLTKNFLSIPIFFNPGHSKISYINCYSYNIAFFSSIAQSVKVHEKTHDNPSKKNFKEN
jgi:hypothetical protein